MDATLEIRLQLLHRSYYPFVATSVANARNSSQGSH